MSQIARAALKVFFETGDKPTQAQFEDLIDSLFNFVDDGIPVSSDKTTQTLSAGDNTINHNLSKEVVNFAVKDGDDFVEVGGSIIDTDNFNINLAAGSITDATIILIYEV